MDEGTQDGYATGALRGFDVGGVVSAALEDKQLRKTAAAGGLEAQQVIDLVHASDVDWGRDGQLATRGRLDDAVRREQATSAALQRAKRRPWWLWLYYALAVTVPLLALFGAGEESGPIAFNGALLIASPFVAIAVWIAYVRTSRRATLEAEARTAMDEALLARQELERELAELLVKPLIRAELNARAGSRYDTSVGAVESKGLAEILDPDYLVPTRSTRRLDRFLKDMPGGSIGLSGPRGAGKSSLIHARCPSGDSQPEGLLGIVVSAPVKFEAREFILHLFSELCVAVLGRETVERLRNPTPRPRASTSLTWALLCSVLVVLAGAALLVSELVGSPSNLTLGAIVTTVGIVSTLVLIALRTRASRLPPLGQLWRLRLPASRPRFSADTRAAAEQQLRAIWFQQTFSEGWSGSLKLPGGLQGGVEGGQELARQQMSMPDIVCELRRLIGMVTADGAVRVRIGIDELDKIDSPEHASSFFNEIKVLFGIPDCFFLVSVSEDALASFERRGMPVRDVFDSSFDDVIRLEHLGAHDSIAMLRERVVRMPTPFLLLCHCLSGGLPRDLIRSARDLVSLIPDEGELRLSQACRQLVAAQLAAKAGGVTTAARRELPPHEAVAIRDFADRLAGDDPEAERLLAYVEETAEQVGVMTADPTFGAETFAAVVSFAAELTTFAYFCSTLLELFDDALPEGHFSCDIHQEDAAQRNGGRSVVDQLAYARQAFAIHPRAAWEAVSGARKATRQDLELQELRYPYTRDRAAEVSERA